MTKSEKANKRRKGCLKWLLFLFALCLAFAIAAGVVGLSVVRHFSKGLPDVSKIRGYEPSQTTKIYSSTGELVATLFKENRTYSAIEDIAPAMRKAIVAVEDSRFHEHIGVDFRGVARAAVYDIRHRGAFQGASTITMQLARNLFLNPTRSLERKIREVLLSIEMEKKFTKDELLELYLNQIYFGSGAYGITSASNLYFGKKPADLSIAEASLLAGLPQAPSAFSPFVSERAAKHRQVLVLGRMRDTNAISQAEYVQALAETKAFSFDKKRDEVEFEVLKLPYFTTYALRQLANNYSEELLYRGGLTIHTTVDVKLQNKCEKILRRMIASDGKKLGADTGAIVLIENRSGYIRAMVGGTGWSQKNQFNRAWQARRQPGSTFKPIVYAAAVEKGWKPSSEIEDAPLTVRLGPEEIWKPKNSDKTYMGKITLATALKYSRNVAAARLGQKIGLDSVIKLARRMGIQEELPPHPSLALGSVEISPLEMATAYTVFPNEGVGVDVLSIKRVVDAREEAVEEHTFATKRDVLSPKVARAMVSMMKGVVDEGTAQKATLKKHDAAGKTGTTDSFRDAWFVGFTADYTAAVWVGRDNNAQMKKSYGGDLPARIWKQVMTEALADKSPSKFFTDPAPKKPNASTGSGPEGSAQEQPDRPKLILTVCKETRLRAQPGCPSIGKVRVDSPDEVDWCSRHSAEAPKATEWEDRSSVRQSPPSSLPKPVYRPEERSNTPPNNPPTDGRPSDNPDIGVEPDISTEPTRRNDGSVRSVRGVGGIESVKPISGGRGERVRGSILDHDGI